MGHTLEQRRGDIRAYANNYKIPVKLSQGELEQCAELAKRDIFSLIFPMPEYTHLFRDTTQTFSHGAAFPANFLSTAGRAWITDGSGGELPVRFAQPSEVPFLTRNSRVAGSATQPVLFLSDKKFYFIPNTVTGAHIELFLNPAPMVNSTDTDSMPEWSEPLIARSGFEYMLKMMVDQQTALEMNKQEVEHAERAIKALYDDKFAILNRDPQEAAQ